MWSGITVVISSVVLIIVGAVKPIILGFVPNVAEVFVDMYLSSAVWSFVMVGTVTLLVGVALIAIYVIANKILENRKQKAIA